MVMQINLHDVRYFGVVFDLCGYVLIHFVAFFLQNMYLTRGCGISLRTVGVASKPVKPCPLSFAGFFIYVKRKFVANLKVIGPLMWK